MGNPGKTPRERILNDLVESLNMLWVATPEGEPLFIAGMRRQLDDLETLAAEGKNWEAICKDPNFGIRVWESAAARREAYRQKPAWGAGPEDTEHE